MALLRTIAGANRLTKFSSGYSSGHAIPYFSKYIFIIFVIRPDNSSETESF